MEASERRLLGPRLALLGPGRVADGWTGALLSSRPVFRQTLRFSMQRQVVIVVLVGATKPARCLSASRRRHLTSELPTLSLLQKTPSSPVTCHATGFYPRKLDLFWRKDGKQLHEDVEMGETLPNHDGTFQTAAHLKVEATAGVEGEYECVFRLAGVEEDMVTKLDGRILLSNARIREEEEVKKMMATVVTLGILALVLLVAVAGFHRQISQTASIVCRASQAFSVAFEPH